MKRLIECVPNFSEGRDAAKVDAIVVGDERGGRTCMCWTGRWTPTTTVAW